MLVQRLPMFMREILQGKPTNDGNVFKEIKAEITAKSNIITQFSTAPAMNPDKPY